VFITTRDITSTTDDFMPPHQSSGALRFFSSDFMPGRKKKGWGFSQEPVFIGETTLEVLY
jgi:hypothetical protein